jgi:VanZ family protein
MKQSLADRFRKANPRHLAIGWTFLILVLLSIPGKDLPQVDFVGIDKPVHAALFFVFTVLWSRVFRRGRLRNLILAMCLAVSFAVLSELYQGILPWERTPDRFDVLANWIGTALAFAVSIARPNLSAKN